MSGHIIVEGLGKRYARNVQSLYQTIREAISGATRSFLSKKGKSTESQFWALEDVSFSIDAGESIGIIGNNGAGKSTLIKILSRITPPTAGKAVIHGRVASLVEVGVGFHPELTGRENIFLYGTILGMRKSEIRAQFDRIVEFSEVGEFIDVPVKRYSSGMGVRLAFSIAAHLSAEILFLDEVLAVGDFSFQSKCIAKMKELVKEGKTLLFVSHNLTVLQQLCPRPLYLKNGRLSSDSATADVVALYIRENAARASVNLAERDDRQGNGRVRFQKVEILNSTNKSMDVIRSGDSIVIRIFYSAGMIVDKVRSLVAIGIVHNGETLINLNSDNAGADNLKLQKEGYVDVRWDRICLNEGRYSCTLYWNFGGEIADWVEDAFQLNIESGQFFPLNSGSQFGRILVESYWKFH